MWLLAAVFAPQLGIAFAGVSLAFGLTVLTMAYTVGHISGGHFNPAVTLGLWAGGRFKAADIVPYIIAQVAGAIAGAAVLYLIASGKPEFAVGVGAYAQDCLKRVCNSHTTLSSIKVSKILHPSPASPAANRGWAAQATQQLEVAGIW